MPPEIKKPIIRKKNKRGYDLPAPDAAIIEHNTAHAVSVDPNF